MNMNRRKRPGKPLDARAEIPRTLELSNEGRRKEAEAEKDIQRGTVKRFRTAEELLADLNDDRGK